MSIVNQWLRLLLTGLHRLMRSSRVIRRPTTLGAHAVALTPAGKIVLVRLRYAPGWRLPGGGRNAGETAEDAAVRELREEIGMTAHGGVQRLCDVEQRSHTGTDLSSIVLVRDVEYRRPRWSWEVEEVSEAAIDDLPPDLSAGTAQWLRAALPKI